MYNLPEKFYEVDFKSQILIEKGDKICLVFKRPFWIPFTKVYEFILKNQPMLKYVTLSHNNKQHYFNLYDSYTDGNFVYLLYESQSNTIPVAVIVILISIAIGGLLGSLSTIAISKVGGTMQQGLTAIFYVIIALVIFFVIFRTISK